jgi:hypothetical protein
MTKYLYLIDVATQTKRAPGRTNSRRASSRMVHDRRVRSVPSSVASIPGRIASPPVPASIVPSIPIVASPPPAVPIPPVPTPVARPLPRPRPRPRPRPTTVPRSIAFVATAPTPIVSSIVPSTPIVSSIVSSIGTPRVRRPRRRSSSARSRSLVVLGQSRLQLVAQFPDSFPPDVLFPGDVFRAARFAVRGREQHGAHRARVRRLRRARFRRG